jgi:hypothetical protein
MALLEFVFFLALAVKYWPVTLILIALFVSIAIGISHWINRLSLSSAEHFSTAVPEANSLEAIKQKAFAVRDKLDIINNNLELLQSMNSENDKDLYSKERDMAVCFYDYYCKYELLYMEMQFSVVIESPDENTLQSFDIKKMTDKFKDMARNDYDITVEYINQEDKNPFLTLYKNYLNELDAIVRVLMELQTGVLMKSFSPIEASAGLNQFDSPLSSAAVIAKLEETDAQYSQRMAQYEGAKEVFG